MTGMMMRFTGLVVIGLLMLSPACGGDDGPVLGGYQAPCMTDGECEADYLCLAGICSIQCAQSGDCSAVSSRPICLGGTCFENCEHNGQCLSGMVCRLPEGTCRPE